MNGVLWRDKEQFGGPASMIGTRLMLLPRHLRKVEGFVGDARHILSYGPA